MKKTKQPELHVVTLSRAIEAIAEAVEVFFIDSESAIKAMNASSYRSSSTNEVTIAITIVHSGPSSIRAQLFDLIGLSLRKAFGPVKAYAHTSLSMTWRWEDNSTITIGVMP